jgi:2,4-dienoyl-CoA reductase-like NADH-dependent reductase (Old Yellow Enzyme family)
MARHPQLFTPLTLRELTLRNRIVVSPMCQYSATDGYANDWHLVHLGSRAVGGAGLVIVEATGVSPQARISPADLGIWLDDQADALARSVRFVKGQGAAAGIQLAHAGRKASTAAPWDGGKTVPKEAGGWTPVAPSAIPFAEGSPVPHALTREEIAAIVGQFEAAALRARAAEFDVIELHAAHGYLLHEFLSPLTNHRDDEFGGSFENRVRFPLQVARAVREAWPGWLPVFVRISATDWVEGGWSLSESIALARELKELGIDLVDCSSGGLVADAKIPVGPGYQAPLSASVREGAGIATGAVGLVTSAEQAEQILATGQADLVLLAREMLRNPYWPLLAARRLGAAVDWPNQYLRARPA